MQLQMRSSTGSWNSFGFLKYAIFINAFDDVGRSSAHLALLNCVTAIAAIVMSVNDDVLRRLGSTGASR